MVDPLPLYMFLFFSGCFVKNDGAGYMLHFCLFHWVNPFRYKVEWFLLRRVIWSTSQMQKAREKKRKRQELRDGRQSCYSYTKCFRNNMTTIFIPLYWLNYIEFLLSYTIDKEKKFHFYSETLQNISFFN